jgi:nucleoside-diphosphate-sugar epimerase
MTSSRAVAITGASGLIGRHLCDHLSDAGWRVRALVRNPAAFRRPGIERERIDLPDFVDQAAFAGIDTVIHAAYATRSTDLAAAQRVNEQGTANILAAARAAGVRKFVFISSLSAHAGATSYYGRSKLAIESRLDASRDLVIRPGLVLAADGGLALRMWQSVARSSIVPIFDRGRQMVQTIHIDDLCTAVERAVEMDLSGVLNLAEPVAIPMSELLAIFARASGTKPFLLPIPSAPALLALRVLESAHVPLPVTAENLRGLRSMRRMETAADLARLGVNVRAAAVSIADLARIPGVPFSGARS